MTRKIIISNPSNTSALNQISKALTHPQRLIRTLHKHHLPILRLTMLGIPLRLLVLKLLVQIHQDHAEYPEPDDGNPVHGGDDAVALAVPVVLQIPDV